MGSATAGVILRLSYPSASAQRRSQVAPADRRALSRRLLESGPWAGHPISFLAKGGVGPVVEDSRPIWLVQLTVPRPTYAEPPAGRLGGEGPGAMLLLRLAPTSGDHDASGASCPPSQCHTTSLSVPDASEYGIASADNDSGCGPQSRPALRSLVHTTMAQSQLCTCSCMTERFGTCSTYLRCSNDLASELLEERKDHSDAPRLGYAKEALPTGFVMLGSNREEGPGCPWGCDKPHPRAARLESVYSSLC